MLISMLSLSLTAQLNFRLAATSDPIPLSYDRTTGEFITCNDWCIYVVQNNYKQEWHCYDATLKSRGKYILEDFRSTICIWPDEENNVLYRCYRSSEGVPADDNKTVYTATIKYDILNLPDLTFVEEGVLLHTSYEFPPMPKVVIGLNLPAYLDKTKFNILPDDQGFLLQLNFEGSAYPEDEKPRQVIKISRDWTVTEVLDFLVPKSREFNYPDGNWKIVYEGGEEEEEEKTFLMQHVPADIGDEIESNKLEFEGDYILESFVQFDLDKVFLSALVYRERESKWYYRDGILFMKYDKKTGEQEYSKIELKNTLTDTKALEKYRRAFCKFFSYSQVDTSTGIAHFILHPYDQIGTGAEHVLHSPLIYSMDYEDMSGTLSWLPMQAVTTSDVFCYSGLVVIPVEDHLQILWTRPVSKTVMNMNYDSPRYPVTVETGAGGALPESTKLFTMADKEFLMTTTASCVKDEAFVLATIQGKGYQKVVKIVY